MRAIETSTNMNGYLVKDIFLNKTSKKEWELFTKDISSLLSNFCKENNTVKKDIYKI